MLTVIDRIFEYMKYCRLSAYNFEKTCGIANGYLKKQAKGKGTIGSEILEKILDKYRDLSLSWLITGKGNMLLETYSDEESGPSVLAEPEAQYVTQNTIQLLKDKITILENTIADKDKIISLLERK